MLSAYNFIFPCRNKKYPLKSIPISPRYTIPGEDVFHKL